MYDAYYVADFETSNTWELGLKAQDCHAWVWLWTITEIGNLDIDEVMYGVDITSFLAKCDELSQDGEIVVFFHNLKYDGSYLLNNLPLAEVETVIDGFGRFYEIKYKNIRFWDSLKKINSSVLQIGRDFKTQYQKIEDFDYSNRTLDYTPTEDDILYAKHDVLVMSEALSELFKNGMKGMTVSGDAFKLAKNSVGWNTFERLFPCSNELDRLIRPSYFGGWVYLNPKYIEKKIQNFFIYDVNSEYPAICVNEPLPHGKPKFVDEIPKGLFIIKFKAIAKLKEGVFPFVSMKGNFRYCQTDLLTETDGLESFTMTSVDYYAFLEYYNVEIYKIDWILSFKSRKGIFKEFIEINYEIKNNSVGAAKAVAKLKMNSFTGRMAMNPERKNKVPSIEDDILKFREGDLDVIDSIYPAFTAFITAYGRRYVHDLACSLGDNFIYSDTDSVHSFQQLPSEKIDNIALGKFKEENVCKCGLYLRPKTYMYTNDKGQTKVKCAGLPIKGKQLITYDNFKPGLVLESVKNQAKQAKGGIILVPGPFKIRV